MRLYNTRTRRKEDFTPLNPADVRMYVCGPTVYERAHLGNARPVVVFDVLYRLLRQVYGADKVRYVRNFTDVDDKINAAALRSWQGGAPGTLEEIIRARTNETIGWYNADMKALGALAPTDTPRATAHIAAMVAMIERLIAHGHAYVAHGHVLFAVERYAAYGALSRRTTEDMRAGARVEVAPFKRNPMDFVLWKPSEGNLPGWESPWGRGRPGWHIECSAMAHALLGASFDIHGGGADLMFPHHENEIAQSRCAHPEGDFARFWLHNEMLQVEGKKMSKSLGNFFTVRDLLEAGVAGAVIRLVMLGTHYRKPMDWTTAKVKEAKRCLINWFLRIKDLPAGLRDSEEFPPDRDMLAALHDDLNTPAAIAALHRLSKQDTAWAHAQLATSMELLGLRDATPPPSPIEYREIGDVSALYAQGHDEADSNKITDTIYRLLDKRSSARQGGRFKEADAIRDALMQAGVSVRDTQGKWEYDIDRAFDAKRFWEITQNL